MKITFDDKYAYLHTEDGREGKLLLSRSPRLARATKEELQDYRFIAGDGGVHWNAIDEDVPFELFFESTEKINLGSIPSYISLSYIAQRFFGKSRSWFTNKLTGNILNGKKAAFTPEEKKILQKALDTIAKEIQTTANNHLLASQ